MAPTGGGLCITLIATLFLRLSQLQERTGVQQREAELTVVRDRFRSGCGCYLNCFADFSVEEVAEARIST